MTARAEMADDAQHVATGIIQQLERAWNSANGRAFGEPFADDADFVTIRGEYFRTRTAIVGGHQGIFDTIYQGSVVQYALLQARKLDDRVILAHVRSTLKAPAGPLAGEHGSVFSLVIVRREQDWQIAGLHNTLMAH